MFFRRNAKTRNGIWGWFSDKLNWKGHQGNYAKWLKDHPECDETNISYDKNKDTCLATEKELEDKEDKEFERFENESVEDEIADEFTYLTDEVQDEYDI